MKTTRNGRRPQIANSNGASSSPVSVRYGSRPPLWTNPVLAMLVVSLLSVSAAAWLDEEMYRELWAVRKYIDVDEVRRICVLLLSAVVGSVIAVTRAKKTRVESPRHFVDFERLYWFVTVIYITSTVVWFAFAFMNGMSFGSLRAAIVEGVPGAYSVNREAMAPRPPFTSGASLGPLVGACAGVIFAGASKELRLARLRWVLVGTLMMAAFRAVARGERLSVLEILVPLAIAYVLGRTNAMATRPAGTRTRRRWTALVAISPLVVLAYFGALESSRSWTFYSAQPGSPSFLEFTMQRAAGYYVLGLNNGALISSSGVDLLRLPTTQTYALQVLEVADPGLLPDPPSERPTYGALLRSANPEFNNPGGISALAADVGLLPAACVWFLGGFGLSRIYSRGRQGSIVAIAGYSILFLAILELPRLFMIGQSRLLIPLLVLLWAARSPRWRATTS